MADASARRPTLLWALFGLDGRVGREVYWLGQIAPACIGVAILHWDVDEAGLVILRNPNLLPFVAAGIGWINVSLAVKRLHDMNLTGWLAGTLLVPILGVVPMIVIGVLRGTAGPNTFGPMTNRRGAS